MSDAYESKVDGRVHLADHTLEKMIERTISPAELADALACPRQTCLQGTRRTCQYRDFAAIVETRSNDVLRVLYRAQGQLTSGQGRPPPNGCCPGTCAAVLSWACLGAAIPADHGTVEGVPGGQANVVEVSDHCPVGRQHADLCVGNAHSFAVFLDDEACSAQVWPGHVREQVVFDLEVQATEHGISERAACDVARGAHLAFEKIRGGVVGQNRHSFVVRGEGGAHVDTEYCQLHAEERARHPCW